ncbi:MAG TPA: hypothetical protein VMW10_09295 [Alphaproteobacteria bacterium]|nr:hypothetical protein [Alphaproteobacteria bacterium]
MMLSTGHHARSVSFDTPTPKAMLRREQSRKWEALTPKKPYAK